MGMQYTFFYEEGEKSVASSWENDLKSLSYHGHDIVY